MHVNLKIHRFHPEQDKKAHWETYKVECEPGDRVLDLLNHIKWYVDPTLTYRRSCAHGICGSDAMLINGRNRLACKILIKDLAKDGGTITVEPIRGLKVEKDLLVDMEPFFESYRAVLPFFINDDPVPAGERLQTQEDRERFDQGTKCILCAACTTSCPIFWVNGRYLGPASIVQAHRFIFDSRDKGTSERLNILNQNTGVWRCRTAYNCTEACPREIPVTQLIEEVKRAVMYQQV
ncbi:succinate dehydrogenase iron-sulfur subunit [Deinococcus peraridilitoris]|uniref:Succinate dehydrogenase iron-sulfur subunit n=1 Tax=Deinococcus peraridilitoris (strain DSM 19664 / LMG 22246 / CIP 109416 / KR-200) TaxID=937777 RepID=L0A4G3_DEIPD|nr:succinate dehydrogenase iron-sulfur subunit [Deinococcus peraridilitoris]AFZ68319.1 succinate dehydrogenase and fumarate reductase iron-sulfur protein [Deinococcus peraridilitoris DSM 19664]